MARIPGFENTVGISAQGSSSLMDTGVVNQNQAAQNAFTSSLDGVFENVKEHFKTAQNINTINDEDNKMMKYFFDLREESKKQPVEQQTAHFDQKSKEYLDGLKTRISDPRVMKEAQNYWRSHTQTGLYDIQDNQRRLTISDGVSKIAEGDRLFSSQIDSWAKNPAVIEQELSKRFGAYDKAVEAGFITPAQAQKSKEELGNQTDYTRALIHMRDNPYDAQKAIGDHEIYAHLNSHTREVLLERTDAKIKADEAEKRREQREAKMMAMAEFGLVKHDISNAAKVYDARGAKPAEWDALMAQASRYKNLDGGRTYQTMMSVEKDAATTIDFKGLSYQEMNTSITSDVDKINSGKGTADDIRQYEKKLSIYQDMATAVKTGDHLRYMEKYHIAPVEQLNPNDKESIDRRIALVDRARQQMGGNPNYFSEKEVGAFARAFTEGNTKDQEALGSMFNRLSSGDPSKLGRMLKQLSIKDTSIADEASFRAEGDNYTAEMMNSGRKKRENGLARNAEKVNTAMSKAIDDMNLSTFDQSGALRKQMMTGLTDVYYGMSKETGDATDSVNSSLVDKAVERYFGGRLVKLNGVKIPPFAQGQSEYDHLTLWNSLNPELIKQGSLSGELPMIRIGTTVAPLAMNELIAKGKLVPFGQGYAISLPNAANTGFDDVVATNPDGSPFIIDMKKIAPKLLAKRQAMMNEHMNSFNKE